jgi:hypothetical protein
MKPNQQHEVKRETFRYLAVIESRDDSESEASVRAARATDRLQLRAAGLWNRPIPLELIVANPRLSELGTVRTIAEATHSLL